MIQANLLQSGTTPMIIIPSNAPKPTFEPGSTLNIGLINFQQGSTIKMELMTLASSQVLYERLVITRQEMEVPITLQRVTPGDYYVKASSYKLIGPVLSIIFHIQ